MVEKDGGIIIPEGTPGWRIWENVWGDGVPIFVEHVIFYGRLGGLDPLGEVWMEAAILRLHFIYSRRL